MFKNIEFGARVGVDIDLCVGLQIPEIGCAGYTASFNESHKFGINVPLPSFLDPIPPLVNVCKGAFRPGANEADLLGCTAGPVKPLFDVWQHSLDTLNSIPGVHYTFAEFSPGTVKLFTPDLPTPLNLTVPQVEAVFKQPSVVSTVGAAVDGSLIAAATQKDLGTASVDVISLLEYVGIPTSVSLGAGLGSIDLGDVSPTFHIDQNMRYEFKPAVNMAMNLAVPMPFKVIDPVAGQVATGTGSVVNFKPGQTVMLSFPQSRRTPVTMTNTYGMNGTLNTRTLHQYRLSVNFKALHLAGPGFDFSALDENVDLSGSVLPEHTIESHTLALPAFAPVTLPGLTLDPEDPRIDVTEHSVRDTLNIGGGERAVVYRTSVANTGDVNLLSADLDLNLSRIFGDGFGVSGRLRRERGFAAERLVRWPHEHRTPRAGDDTGAGTAGHSRPAGPRHPGDRAGKRQRVLHTGAVHIVLLCEGGQSDWNSRCAATSTSALASPLLPTPGPRWISAPAPLPALISPSMAQIPSSSTESQACLTATSAPAEVSTFKKSGAAEPLRIVGDLHAGRDLHVQQSQVLSDYVQVHDNVHMDKKSSLVLNGALSESSDCNTAFELPSMVFMRPSGAAARIAVAEGGRGVARCRRLSLDSSAQPRNRHAACWCLQHRGSRDRRRWRIVHFRYLGGDDHTEPRLMEDRQHPGVAVSRARRCNPCGAHQLRRQRGTGVQECRAARHAGCARRGGQAG